MVSWTFRESTHLQGICSLGHLNRILGCTASHIFDLLDIRKEMQELLAGIDGGFTNEAELGSAPFKDLLLQVREREDMIAYVSAEDICACGLGIKFACKTADARKHTKARVPSKVIQCLLKTGHGRLPNGDILTYKGRPIFSPKKNIATAVSALGGGAAAAMLSSRSQAIPLQPKHPSIVPEKARQIGKYLVRPGTTTVPPHLKKSFSDVLKAQDTQERLRLLKAAEDVIPQLPFDVTDDFVEHTAKALEALAGTAHAEMQRIKPLANLSESKTVKVLGVTLALLFCVGANVCNEGDVSESIHKHHDVWLRVANAVLSFDYDQVQSDRKFVEFALTAAEIHYKMTNLLRLYKSAQAIFTRLVE